MAKASAKKSQKTTKGPSKKDLPPFDKYRYYLESVQSPVEDMRFMEQVYRDANGKKADAKIFREDFCGTFANCKAWVELGDDKIAHGVDLDPEPLEWGKQHHLAPLPKAAPMSAPLPCCRSTSTIR